MFEQISNMGEPWVFAINVLCILFGGIFITWVITRILKRILRKSSSVDNAITSFIVTAVKIVCGIIIAAAVLQTFGVPISTIVAILGAAGAAVAIALRDAMANLVGGIMIVMMQPFGEGDIVEIEGSRGKIERINLFTTTMKTLDYKTVTVPNGKINTAFIYNETERSIRRCDCNFRISYDSDIERVKEIVRNVCDGDAIILDEPKPWIGIVKHDEFCMILEVQAYCKTEDLWDAKYYLNETIKVAFDEAGIDFPYPHTEVVQVKKKGLL